MATWKKAVVVALAAVVGFVPMFACVSHAQAVPVNEAPVTLPVGDELSDAELLGVKGEQVEVVVASVLIGAAIGYAGHELSGEEDTAGKLARDIGLGALGGLVGYYGAPILGKGLVLARRGLVEAARWTARVVPQVAAATADKALTFVSRVSDALHRFHAALHNYVREPVVNFFCNVWDQLRGR